MADALFSVSSQTSQSRALTTCSWRDVQFPRRPYPIDQMQTYLTADESLGQSVELELVVHTLSRVSLEEALTWTARWMAAIRRPGSRQQAVDAGFAPTPNSWSRTAPGFST